MAKENSGMCERPKIENKKTETTVEFDGAVIPGKEMGQNMIKVGKAAPDFTAPAFFNGKFTKVSLSDYKGKWVSLCFYPGDFTFV